MKSLSISLILFLILSLSTQLEAGNIRGKISAQVTPNITEGRNNDSYGSRKYKFLEQVDYSSFRNFVISIESIGLPKQDTTSPRTVQVEQKDGQFVPHVLPIVQGTAVEWPNRDEIFHNVFSISEARPFDLGYYKSKDDAKTVIFETPGRVDVFCSIHSQMNCIVLVMPNSFFSLSDKRGNYEIKNVPAGTYKLKAWHERLPPKYLDVVVPEEGTVNLDIFMGLSDLPKY